MLPEPDWRVEEGRVARAVDARFKVAAQLGHRVRRVEIEDLIGASTRVVRGRLGESKLIRDAVTLEADIHRREAGRRP